jgi:hypothetical protein
MKEWFSPTLKMNVLNKMKIPAYFLISRKGHITAHPFIGKNGPRTHNAFELTSGSGFDLKGYERPAPYFDLFKIFS